MIELRWRVVTDGTNGSVQMDAPGHFFKVSALLQYRAGESSVKASGSFVDPDIEILQEWSDWQDVPIFDERATFGVDSR